MKFGLHSALVVFGGLLACVLQPSIGCAQSFNFYGAGCAGNGINHEFFALNPNANNLSGQDLPNEYCYPVQTTNAIAVEGFRLYTRTRAPGQLSMLCALYLQSLIPGTPDTTAAAVGTMTVGFEEGWYEVRFPAPVAVPANSRFWVSQYESSTILPADLANGNPPPGAIYFRRPAGTGTNWFVTGLVNFPAYRIITSGAGPMVMTHRGSPTLGGSLSLLLHHARPGTVGNLNLGVSDTTLAGLPILPLDLTSFGAPGCTLLSSIELSVGFGTDAMGAATLTLPVPNDPFFSGAQVFSQMLVIDPAANALNITSSNGGAATIL